MEQVREIEPGKATQVALFSDNSPTVSWVDRIASQHAKGAEQLVRALALRPKQAGTCPLTPLHVQGKKNTMTDIPSRSFWSNPAWHCRSNTEQRALFNKNIPLPDQQSWTVFQPLNETSMRVISILQTKVMTMAEWRQLRANN